MRIIESLIYPRRHVEVDSRKIRRDVSASIKADEIGHRGANDCGLETGRVANRPGTHEAAIAPAADSQPVGISNPLSNEIVDAAQDVFEIHAAPIRMDRLGK